MKDSSDEKTRYYRDRAEYRELYLAEQRRCGALSEDNAALRAQLTALERENARLGAELGSMLRSRSWRMTAPLRRMAEGLRRSAPAPVPAPEPFALSEWSHPRVTEALLEERRARDSDRTLRFGVTAPVISEALRLSLASQSYENAALTEDADYVVLLAEGCVLHPLALSLLAERIEKDAPELLFGDEALFRSRPSDSFYRFYRSDYSPYTLRCGCMPGSLMAIARPLWDRTAHADASPADFDLVLRLCESAKGIAHVPQLLCWRQGSEADIPVHADESGRAALQRHLERGHIDAEAHIDTLGEFYGVRYLLRGTPRVSILIPTREQPGQLSICLESLFGITSYGNYEVILLRNGEESEEAELCYREAQARWPQLRIARYAGEFNFSAICNAGVRMAQGEYIVLLNNDTEVINPDWLQDMLMLAQRADVGIVGAKLLYSDGRLQHGGIFLGSDGTVGHFLRESAPGAGGYMGRLHRVQELSAVTGACVMLRRAVWDRVGGMDESFAVTFNDVDLCMRLREAGLRVLWTNCAQLYHFECRTRGYEIVPERAERFKEESERFRTRWASVIEAGDPFYNPNLVQDRETMDELPA